MFSDVENVFGFRDLFYSEGDVSSPLSYVHPWVITPLSVLIDNVPDTVDAIIVYGSALGDFMKTNSDLDLAVVSKYPDCYSKSYVKSLGLDIELDVKVFASWEDLISQAEGWFPTPVEILKNGLPVYVRGRKILLAG